MNRRWVQIGILALALFAVNAIARLVTKWGDFAKPNDPDPSALDTIGVIASISFAAVLLGAGVWWAVNHPFGRLVADIGAATLVGTLLALLIGPLLVGNVPFEEGLGMFVGQFLMFLGLGAVGAMLGFAIMVAFGKDWKSRGLRRYEESYRRRPHRTVKG